LFSQSQTNGRMKTWKAGFISIVIMTVVAVLMRFTTISEYYQGYILGAGCQFTYWVILFVNKPINGIWNAKEKF